MAVSDKPIKIIIEFCAFSFTPFNRHAIVNSLDDLLSYYDQEDLHCVSFQQFCIKCLLITFIQII